MKKFTVDSYSVVEKEQASQPAREVEYIGQEWG